MFADFVNAKIESANKLIFALFADFTLTLEKSRMPQIQGVGGEAVELYREPLATQEMWYHRLSLWVNNMAAFRCFQDFARSVFL